jgi:glucosylceramidase
MVTVDLRAASYTLRPEFYVMKHFSRFIHPGAIRLGLSGQWAGNAVAFRNPDGQTVAVVHNPLGSRQALTMEADGSMNTITMPPHSFNTLVL